MQSKYAWEFLQKNDETTSVRYIKDNEWSERTYEDKKGMLTFFQKYTKTPSDRIKKKGSLLLTIYFPDYSTQWIFKYPAVMKRIF